MSIWATRLYFTSDEKLADAPPPYKYDHYNNLGERMGELEIAWPPGIGDSLRLFVNSERVLLDRNQARLLRDTLTTFLADQPPTGAAGIPQDYAESAE